MGSPNLYRAGSEAGSADVRLTTPDLASRIDTD